MAWRRRQDSDGLLVTRTSDRWTRFRVLVGGPARCGGQALRRAASGSETDMISRHLPAQPVGQL